MPPRLNVGLIGLGRLGRVYARDLAGRIPETRLVAVADIAAPGERVGGGIRCGARLSDPMALIDDPNVDALVIVTPTHAHREQVHRGSVTEEADVLRKAARAVFVGSRGR